MLTTYKFFLLTTLWCLTTVAALAQDMTLVTQSDGNIVRLRWSVAELDHWQLANDNGYTITRMTRSVNGTELDMIEQFMSRVVLIDDYAPLAENSSDWPTDDLSEVAQSVLYSDDWDPEVTDFASAVLRGGGINHSVRLSPLRR